MEKWAEITTGWKKKKSPLLKDCKKKKKGGGGVGGSGLYVVHTKKKTHVNCFLMRFAAA